MDTSTLQTVLGYLNAREVVPEGHPFPSDGALWAEVAPERYAFMSGNLWFVASDADLRAIERFVQRQGLDPNVGGDYDRIRAFAEDAAAAMPPWWTPEKQLAFAVNGERFPYDPRQGDQTGTAGESEAAALGRAINNDPERERNVVIVMASLETGEEISALLQPDLQPAVDYLGAVEISPKIFAFRCEASSRYAVTTANGMRHLTGCLTGKSIALPDGHDPNNLPEAYNAWYQAESRIVEMPAWWSPTHRYATVFKDGRAPIAYTNTHEAFWECARSYSPRQVITVDLETGEEIPFIPSLDLGNVPPAKLSTPKL